MPSLTDSKGFAGLTPLHEIALLKSPTEVASFLPGSSLHMETNFLGQTPLHLAVRDVEIVRLLVQDGYDMDVPDSHGISPLMYAAGMGKTDVVRFLINQGADLFIRDTRWKRTFIGYADARGHWELIIDALTTIQATYPKRFTDYFVCDALMRLISGTRIMWQSNEWSIYFAKLLALGRTDTCNISIGNDGTEDNNFLHFISSYEDVDVLAQHGFNLFNQPNSAGNTAIFSLAGRLDPTLLQSLIDHGTNINHVNHEGRTLLLLLLKQLSYMSHRAFDVMDSIRLCLKSGLDIFLSDRCRCPCSPDGCFLPAAFDITFEGQLWTNAPAFVWALELLSLVEELRGREDSKKLLLGFLRRAYFDKTGMTHVCCHRGNSIQGHSLLQPERSVAEADIDEILEEEEEFIASLEEEMLPLNSETLECLRSKWMSMLKERYQEQVEEVERTRKQNNHHETPIGVSSSSPNSGCPSDKDRKRSRLIIGTTRSTMYIIQALISPSLLA